MTVTEFRCWLEGFSFLFSSRGYPNETEWKAIKEKLDRINTVGDLNNTWPGPFGVPSSPGIYRSAGDVHPLTVGNGISTTTGRAEPANGPVPGY